MYSAIAQFLGARDICAMSQTCARMRNSFGTRDAWHALVRARFPYKQCVEQCNPRNFLLLLEDRITYGRNRARIYHYAGDNIMSCIAADRDLILRGDIIIDDVTQNKYIYDGMVLRPIQQKRWDYLWEYLDLCEVFSIPLEFCVDYYFDLPSPCDIIVRIDKRARLRVTSHTDMCTFECDDRCDIFIDKDYTFETIKEAIDNDIVFVLCVRDCTDSSHFVMPAEWYR